MRTYRNRNDHYHREAVQALRDFGCIVRQPGQPTDLVIEYRGLPGWVEVKSQGGKLTAVQQDWEKFCAATGLFFYVMRPGRAVSDILDAMVQHYSGARRLKPLVSDKSTRKTAIRR